MKDRTFLRTYWESVLRPSRSYAEFLKEKRALRFSVYAIGITAVTYTLVYIFLILGGGQPFKPWLSISLETYYRYNVFFCAPSMFLGWILAAGVVHSVSRMWQNSGSFEAILTAFGFGISIASWSTGIHDLLTSFLGAIHVIDQGEYELALNSDTFWRTLLWIQMLLYVFLFVVFFSKAVKVVYGSSSFVSAALGLFGFLIYQLFFLIFNR